MSLALVTGLCMSAQLVGSPSVDYTVDEVGTDFITITFTPNADAAGYAICLFEAGTAEQQFAMFGPWMGFVTMGDMIKAWGITQTETYQYTWTNQNPGTDYEIYVQCWDVNNVDADMIIIPVTTLNMGGEGVAEMTIEIGEFGGDEDYGYYQWVTYIPNENVSLHRDIIIEKEAYESEEWGEENLLNYLKQDNPWDPYWDQYGIDEAQWSAKPDTWYIAFSIAKNANDEWGPLAGVEFKTPGNSTGVNELASGKAQIIIGANAITATGNKADSEEKVYDMNGRMVASACADANGNAIISTSGLNHGVYVVVNGKSAQKFMK
jgi:hypothetical protein